MCYAWHIRTAQQRRPLLMVQRSAFLAAACLTIASTQPGCVDQTTQSMSTDYEAAGPSSAETIEPLSPSPEDLNQLVAPIALYPDRLVAQILAASTYPTEVVEADRWMREHADLKGDALAKSIDPQPWDPSVKALTQFPQVLDMMDKNLSWTSALGQAYSDGPQPVMDAVQVMRHRAQQAGNLASNPQETVQTEGPSVVIEPADPAIVYLPVFDPWLAYGEPIGLYPDWYFVPGLYIDGPGLAFGLGVGIGVFGGYGWGWNNWGADWRGRGVLYNRGPWRSHSPTFLGHNGGRPGYGFHPAPRPGFSPRPNVPSGREGFGGGVRSGAFSGFNHGGMARSFGARGGSSFRGGFGGARSGGHR
jgi:hypothetical protein